MKKILITGKNSYIGTSLERWLANDNDRFVVHTLDVKDAAWEEHDFSTYDVVFHVAALVHKSENPSMAAVYFKVNHELAVQVATKAKAEGVTQLIFMSTMAVYGEVGRIGAEFVITELTPEQPKTLYGASKLAAERSLVELNDVNFKVVVIRPPTVYGPNCPGNYASLKTFALVMPVFPLFQNKRSMLHIDNLSEFVKLMIDYDEQGVFFPQDGDYVSTCAIVKAIAETNGKRVRFAQVPKSLILPMGRLNVVRKLFGNLVYAQSISTYKADYRVRSFAVPSHADPT